MFVYVKHHKYYGLGCRPGNGNVSKLAGNIPLLDFLSFFLVRVIFSSETTSFFLWETETKETSLRLQDVTLDALLQSCHCTYSAGNFLVSVFSHLRYLYHLERKKVFPLPLCTRCISSEEDSCWFSWNKIHLESYRNYPNQTDEWLNKWLTT